MKRFVLLTFFIPLSLLSAQTTPFEVNSTVDTSNADIAQVVRLWQNYLNSRPDSDYANPYWSAAEQRRYHPFDLAANTWWGTNMYKLVLLRLRAQLLSVSRAGDDFILRTLFYLPSSRIGPGSIGVSSIIRTGACLENGTYKLCNVLSIDTKRWGHESVGNITFVFPPEHRFDSSLARSMRKSIDSLAALWKTSLPSTEYFFADDLDRVAKVLGLDYYGSEGNVSGTQGFVNPQNHLIFAGGNEWYIHEFVHALLMGSLTAGANPYFNEGYATLVGGSRGEPLSALIRRNYDFLKGHPEIDILTFEGVDKHGARYYIGGLLCMLAEEKGGLAQVQKLMTYGKEDADLYRAIKEVFGVDKEQMNSFLLSALASHCGD